MCRSANAVLYVCIAESGWVFYALKASVSHQETTNSLETTDTCIVVASQLSIAYVAIKSACVSQIEWKKNIWIIIVKHIQLCIVLQYMCASLHWVNNRDIHF